MQTRVRFLQVACPADADWEHAQESASSSSSMRQAAAECLAADVPTVLALALTPLGGRDGTQGAALPGMVTAAILGALQGSGCGKELSVRDQRLVDALEPFGYDLHSQSC
jgi:hypothetical protein